MSDQSDETLVSGRPKSLEKNIDKHGIGGLFTNGDRRMDSINGLHRIR